MSGLFSKLNSPLEQIDVINDVEIWIKREDMIHAEVSGNKWRKLKYYLEDFKQSGKSTILTFGGAFSNHLAATAALGQMANIPTKALVRGEEIESNDTLDFCRSCGMEIESISRKRYDTKDSPEFKTMMGELLPEVYMIPEGGKGVLGIRGCMEILDEVENGFDYVACSGGTGTTMAGLLLSGYAAQFLLFPALKGGAFLRRDIQAYITDFQKAFSTKGIGKISGKAALKLAEDYHFGGYGKVSSELITFMNEFHDQYGIPLDPVYTGKMMFGLWDMIKSGKLEKGSKVLVIHTGGLQGIKGMNQRLKKSGIQINYEA